MNNILLEDDKEEEINIGDVTKERQMDDHLDVMQSCFWLVVS